ncbi:hypothetical protein [Streptococcus suis]|uniref:Uncharacterized protein n=1 Tax=Streptococcus suis TaxID=1307 RepID=A0A426G530_STRSU|nr:hypothetical protein [Streptococcus suis]RRN50118.1 hypothetical protein EI219_04925 [Streptococcus suis]
MTNEKLGVLLVDVPEPRYWNYIFVIRTRGGFFDTCGGAVDLVTEHAYRCTQEEAKKYPQFRWVALEELK